MAPSQREKVALTIIFSLVVLSSCKVEEEAGQLRSEEEMRWIYEEWALHHDKYYSSLSEKGKRFEIFEDNLRFIDQHNSQENNSTYKVGLNQFADLGDDEFRALYLGPPINISDTSAAESKRYRKKIGQYLPTSVDWRRWGAVSPVKNQGICQSCRAFAVAAAVEGLQKIATGRLLTVSEQELVDCDRRNKGCEPGYISQTYQYIMENGGVDTDSHYPYKGVRGQCRPDRRRVVRISGFRTVPSYNHQALQYAVAYQPVTVLIEAYSRGFRFYKSGVFSGPCGAATDHFLTVIGYGMDQRGVPYWLLKNSWGVTWGEGGFGRIRRGYGRTGLCGILTQPQYPLMNRWVDSLEGETRDSE